MPPRAFTLTVPVAPAFSVVNLNGVALNAVRSMVLPSPAVTEPPVMLRMPVPPKKASPARMISVPVPAGSPLTEPLMVTASPNRLKFCTPEIAPVVISG